MNDDQRNQLNSAVTPDNDSGTTSPGDAASTTSSTRRFWPRLQFSMSTMLMLTVITSIGMWYYYRPTPMESTVTGGGKEIYHYKDVESEDGQNDLTVRHGHYVLLNKDNQVQVRGFYKDDVAQGRWTYYYNNGQRKATGKCSNGTRTGIWYSWDENGNCLSKVTFSKPAKVTEKDEDYYISRREGSSETWWPNGTIRAHGNYLDDKRDGQWEFKNEKGELTASGHYVDGKREGNWQVLNSDSKQLHSVYFVHNREFKDVQHQLTRLRKSFSVDDPSVVATASSRLSELNENAKPIVTAALAQQSPLQRITAAHTILNMPNAPAELAGPLKNAATDQNARVRVTAKTAHYVVSTTNRAEAFAEAIDEASKASYSTQLWFAKTIAECNTLNLEDVERAANHDDADIRLLACDVLFFIDNQNYSFFYSRLNPKYVQEVRTLLEKLRKHNRSDVARAAQLILDRSNGNNGFGNSGFTGCIF